MTVYPLRSRYWLLATGGAIVVFGIVALILIAGPSGSARVVGVPAGLAVGAFGAWFVWSLRQMALVLDGDRLGRRTGLRARVGCWIELRDVELVTDAPMSSSVSRRRRDAVLWTPSTADPRLSIVVGRWLMLRQQRDLRAAVEAHSPKLYPFVVQYSTLGDADAVELHDALSAMLAKVPDIRPVSTRRPLGSS